MDRTLRPVGRYIDTYNRVLGIQLPCNTIFQSGGLFTHISKRHPECLKYIDKINDIISNPDYLGVNPKEENSIEFVKRYSDNILVAVKLDSGNNYLYVASLYKISEGKLERRIHSKRFIKISLDNL